MATCVNRNCRKDPLHAIDPVVATSDGDLACSPECFKAYQDLMDLCDLDVEQLQAMSKAMEYSGYSGASGYSSYSAYSGTSGFSGNVEWEKRFKKQIERERDRMWCEALICADKSNTDVMESVARYFNHLRRKKGEVF
jgi:hypothetical protein